MVVTCILRMLIAFLFYIPIESRLEEDVGVVLWPRIRNSFWYPDFDLFKYILWGKYGDIEGKVRSLNRVFMYRRARRRRRESRSLIAKHASASVQRGAQFQHARVQHELAQPAQRALLVH